MVLYPALENLNTAVQKPYFFVKFSRVSAKRKFIIKNNCSCAFKIDRFISYE